MTLEEIKKLTELARIDIPDEELTEIGASFDAILAYVGQIKEVDTKDMEKVMPLKNVMRDDIVTNQRGEYTDAIVEQMPDSENGYLKVKSIL